MVKYDPPVANVSRDYGLTGRTLEDASIWNMDDMRAGSPMLKILME